MSLSSAARRTNPDMQLPSSAYSARRARKGQDIGKKGKNFAKIVASDSKRYGSKSAGERVAGAVLRNLRS